MKRFSFIALILTILAVFTTAADKPASAIVFDSKVHEFGIVNHDGGPVRCEFSFTNTGDAPLVIVSANASCGCTQPKYSRDPVAPGKSGKIRVTFLPQTTVGNFSKTIKVRTNDPKNKKVVLRITGRVVPSAKASDEKPAKPQKK